MAEEDSDSTWVTRALSTVGRGLAVSGVFVGKKAAAAYRSIDPDVQRHLIQIPLLSYSLFTSNEVEVEALPPDGHLPLILVHGHMGNRGNFIPMSWAFWLKGRKRTYRIGFPPGESIDEQARTLAKFVRRVCKVNGVSQVELVAHSLGGVVARLAVQDHRLGRAVKTLVTLGAPHQGTFPARYANTPILRDLRPGSELVKRINAGKMPHGVRVVTMWSRNDLFVLPAESALLEGAEQVDLTPFTHYSYLVDPRGFEAVRMALRGPVG